MIDFESLYLHAPIWLQRIIVSIEGYKIQRQRYSSAFYRRLREYERRLLFDSAEIQGYRDKRLRSFVFHCEHHVPYYRKLFKNIGITSNDICTLEDLQLLPVLTKQTVQNNYVEFIAENVKPQYKTLVHTSGTTGAGLRFWSTKEALHEQWAAWWRYRRMHDIQIDAWCGYFGGRSIVPLWQNVPPYWRINYPAKQIMFSGYHMNENNLPEYIKCIRKEQPLWLHGYPSLISLIADYMLENSISLDYQVKWITIGAENLLEKQRISIKRAFGVSPKQHYGLAEAVANISEHPDGRLRVDEDFSAVEFLPRQEGSGYRIIGTNFTNYATPLLRYDTNDIAQIVGTDRSAEWRVVSEIDGRNEDYIILKNGTKIGRMDHIFKDMINVRESQIIQNVPGQIKVCIRRCKQWSSADERKLLLELQKRVGTNMDIEIDYVSQLIRSKTGKLRFVVSQIARNEQN
jgi:phenylacetate-CoA ligase